MTPAFRVATYVALALGFVWLGYQFWRLCFQPLPKGAVDLMLRCQEVEGWFDGTNPYLDGIRKNLSFLQRVLDGEHWELLRRRPPTSGNSSGPGEDDTLDADSDNRPDGCDPCPADPTNLDTDETNSASKRRSLGSLLGNAAQGSANSNYDNASHLAEKKRRDKERKKRLKQRGS